MNKADPITSAIDVRKAVEEGWELWYVARRDRLHGHWELRCRSDTTRVHWDAIIRLRRNLRWWVENTDEIEHGRSWCYKLRQSPQMELLA